MNDLFLVFIFSLLGGILSLGGGLLLLMNKRFAGKLVTYLTPFAAGALLAAAFIDILPEAAHDGNIEVALRWAMIGILVFFMVERFLHWFHHHHSDSEEKTDTAVPLIIAGDTIHNFLDGIAIAAAFLISVPTGIVTTLAVAAHEIPQEIGDFGLLLSKGMKQASVIKANIASSLATTIAAVTFYSIGDSFEISLSIALGLVAGFLIYIAVSDIIPEIHNKEGHRFASTQTAMLLIGAIIISITTSSLHNYIEPESAKSTADHSHQETHSHD